MARVTDGHADAVDRLPPGQRRSGDWPVLHYGPVPRFQPETWDLRVFGATASGAERRWTFPDLAALPKATVRGDFHCVTKFSVLDNVWKGIATRTIVDLAPPDDGARHVMVWAEYGYSANLRMSDFAAVTSILATHCNGAPLSPDHGWPLRLVVPHLYAWKGPKWVRGIEYLLADQRGFWEERGYHNVGDPWGEQRYSYQEHTGEGPNPLRDLELLR